MISVRVEGVARLVRALLRARTGLLNLDMGDIATEGARLAKAAAPKLSGRLAGSIRPSTSRNRASISAGGASVPYAGVLNFGWPRHHIEATNFMQRADEQLRRVAPRRLERTVQRLIRTSGLA